MVVLGDRGTVLTVSENGYGKRTECSEYPRRRRGGMGVIDIKTSDRNGAVVSCKQVDDDDEVMVITQQGIMIRVPVQGISRIGRNTQGVRVISVDDGDRVIDMTRIVGEEAEGGNAEEGGNGQLG